LVSKLVNCFEDSVNWNITTFLVQASMTE